MTDSTLIDHWPSQPADPVLLLFMVAVAIAVIITIVRESRKQ